MATVGVSFRRRSSAAPAVHLSAVAVALANGNVWAVGQFFQNSQSRSRTLTELWNGSSWSVVSSPNRGPSHNFLNAVTATPSGTLWAVGAFYNNQSIERTLILQKLP